MYQNSSPHVFLNRRTITIFFIEILNRKYDLRFFFRNSSVNSARDTITRGNMTTSSFISNRNQPDLTPMPTTELAPLTPQSSIQGSTQPSVILDVDPRKNIAVPSAEEKRLTRISIGKIILLNVA